MTRTRDIAIGSIWLAGAGLMAIAHAYILAFAYLVPAILYLTLAWRARRQFNGRAEP